MTRKILRAGALYFGTLAVVFFAAWAGKKLLVGAMGERMYRLPELQMERLGKVMHQQPVTTAKMLILGDSTAAYSIDALVFPDAFALTTVNSTSIEAFYMLKKVLESGAAPRCVLASFSMIWDLNRDYFFSMYVANRFYTDEDLAEIYERSRANGDSPGAHGQFLFGARRFLAEVGFLDDYTLRRIQDAISALPFVQARVRQFRNSLRLHRGSSPLHDTTNFDGRLEMTYPAPPRMSRTEMEYFARFLNLLESKGIPFYLYKVPFASTVPQAYEDGFWREYDTLLGAVRPGKGPGFQMLIPPKLADHFHINAGHLNAAGIARTAPFLKKMTADCFR